MKMSHEKEDAVQKQESTMKQGKDNDVRHR
jgi:hypothetical protein